MALTQNFCQVEITRLASIKQTPKRVTFETLLANVMDHYMKHRSNYTYLLLV